MIINFGPNGQKPKNPLVQVLMAIGGLILLGIAFTFSLVFFAVIIVIGLGYWLYFWWKTRSFRKILKEQIEKGQREASTKNTEYQYQHDSESIIIEGDAVRLPDESDDDHKSPKQLQ